MAIKIKAKATLANAKKVSPAVQQSTTVKVKNPYTACKVSKTKKGSKTPPAATDISSVNPGTQAETGATQEVDTTDQSAAVTNLPPHEADDDDGVEEQLHSDLLDTVLSDADHLLDLVYGDHVHQNDATHMDGGIADDATWQGYYQWLVVYKPSL